MSGSDRKDRIREYKESARPMGVFVVRDERTGKVFLGSTLDLPAMLNRQRFQLEMGGHPNKELQRDWDAAGGEGFSIEVLDVLPAADEPGTDPAEDLRVLEELWLDRLRPYGERGYNRQPKGRD